MRKALLLIGFLLFSAVTQAQCAMCRAVIENSGDNATAEGLNNGITYLMVFPYLIVGAILFIIYKGTKK